jgi:hypothetical protein
MNYRTPAAHLQLFIGKQSNIVGLWDGKEPSLAQDNAHTASDLIELAQPLFEKLQELIANEDFVPPAKQ